MSCTAASDVTMASRKPFRNGLAAVGVVTASVYCVDSDVANEQRAAARQGEGRAVGSREGAVRVQAARERFVALFEGGFERPLHDAGPVRVDARLVFAVDRGDGIFAVLDGGDGRLEDDIFHAGGMRPADGIVWVDLDVDVEAVVAEEDVCDRPIQGAVSYELGSVIEAGLAAADRERNRCSCVPSGRFR